MTWVVSFQNNKKLEWLSRDNFSSPLFSIVTYRYVKNRFTHLLDRCQITSCLDSKLFSIFMNQKFQFMIYTSQWPFYHLTFNLPEQMFHMNNCHIILKSMLKCTSYGPNKLNLWSFYDLTFKCDLDFQSTWTNVSNGTSNPQAQQLCQII